LDGCCDEGNGKTYHQNRNPDCALCIHFNHCRAPSAPGILLPCSAVRRKCFCKSKLRAKLDYSRHGSQIARFAAKWAQNQILLTA
jgi:hypothetical protein